MIRFRVGILRARSGVRAQAGVSTPQVFLRRQARAAVTGLRAQHDPRPRRTVLGKDLEAVIRVLDRFLSKKPKRAYVTVPELLAEAFDIDPTRVSSQGLEARTVGRAMKQLGWEKSRARTPAGRVWRYVRPHEAPRVGRSRRGARAPLPGQT